MITCTQLPRTSVASGSFPASQHGLEPPLELVRRVSAEDGRMIAEWTNGTAKIIGIRRR
jgi:hypothetical protein